MPRKKIEVDNWKEMAVQKVGIAFNKHFWKIIFVLITFAVAFSGFTYRSKKGTYFEKKPIFKEMQVGK